MTLRVVPEGLAATSAAQGVEELGRKLSRRRHRGRRDVPVVGGW